MMESTACFSLLDFEPPEVPKFQQGTSREGDVLSMSKMIDYIVKAKQRWRKICELESCSDNRLKSVVERHEVFFVYHTCQQEDIGIADKAVIRQIIEERRCGKHKCHLENYPNSAYLETVNFYEAYKMLQDLGRKEAEADPDLNGLVEVDAFILGTHERLMRGLSIKTPGGLFSTEVRHTIVGGELHLYPRFETHNEARDAVMRIVDRYNNLLFSIRNHEQQDEYAFVRNMFKCATWLFHELLSLHPFGDGNGRLCRLILNYVIQAIVPVPVPLRDIFESSRDRYLSAVIPPRKSEGPPTDLMRLLVESTYDSWVTLFDDLDQVDVIKSAHSCLLSREKLDRKLTQTLANSKETAISCTSSFSELALLGFGKFQAGRSVQAVR